MTTRLTQAIVDRWQDMEPGKQVYDATCPGLRLIPGSKSASFKLAGRINDGSGRYVSLSIGRVDQVSLKTARERAQELKLALARGEDPRRPKRGVPTVAQAFETYLEDRPDLSPETVRWYRSKFSATLKPFHKTPVDKLTRDQVADHHVTLTRRSGKGAANGSMRLLRALIQDVSRRHDLPNGNVVARAVKFHKESPRPWALSGDEIAEVWRGLDRLADDDPIRRGGWLILFLTGLRLNEAVSLAWDDIDDDGVAFIKDPKGGPDKAFYRPLPRLLIQELEHLRDLTAPLESPFIFPAPRKKTGHIHLRRTKDFDFSPHMFRHTVMTVGLDCGVEMATMQLLLNHRPASVSWRYVGRGQVMGPIRDASEMIAERLASHRGKAV